MMRIRFTILGLLLLTSAAAFGQATRTWVSGVGDDVNPCSRTAPCKTFAGAISKTAAGGEIDVLDPGGYGAVTITKSLTIDGLAQMSSILVGAGNGININALSTDVVTIRNLHFNGGTPTSNGATGIRVTQAGRVLIENCKIFGFGTHGIQVVNTSNTIKVMVTGSTISNNGLHGMSIVPVAPGAVTLTVDRSSFVNNTDSGAEMFNNVKGSIVESEFSNNVGSGIIAGSSFAVLDITSSSFANNAFGVRADSTSTVRLHRSQVTRNTTHGLFLNGGSILSHGNNAIRGNTGNETPTPPALNTQ